MKEFFNGMSWSCAGGQSKAGPPSCAHYCNANTFKHSETNELTAALGVNPEYVYFQFGEANGAQDENRDRVYISTYNTAGSTNVDAPQGLGSFMSVASSGYMTSNNVGYNHDHSMGVGGYNFYDLWVGGSYVHDDIAIST
eukprot:UN34203